MNLCQCGHPYADHNGGGTCCATEYGEDCSCQQWEGCV